MAVCWDFKGLYLNAIGLVEEIGWSMVIAGVFVYLGILPNKWCVCVSLRAFISRIVKINAQIKNSHR